MVHRVQCRMRTVGATVAVATGLLIAAAPASGWLRDVSVVQDSSPSNSSARKFLSIACPGGKIALGAAAFTTPLANLGINRAAPPPNAGGTVGWAGTTETDSVGPAWTLHGRAFCAANVATPPPIGGAGNYVKAVEIVRNRSGSNSQPVKSATARCPAGKHAISGGGRIEGNFANLAITATHRVEGNRGWRVEAREVDEAAASWRVHASAVCANVRTETATADYAGPTFFGPDMLFPLGSGTLQSVAPSCPAGTFVVGGGSAVLGPAGQPPPTDVSLIASEPPGASAWLAIARETDPTNAQWRVAARVLCAPLNGGPPA